MTKIFDLLKPSVEFSSDENTRNYIQELLKYENMSIENIEQDIKNSILAENTDSTFVESIDVQRRLDNKIFSIRTIIQAINNSVENTKIIDFLKIKNKDSLLIKLKAILAKLNQINAIKFDPDTRDVINRDQFDTDIDDARWLVLKKANSLLRAFTEEKLDFIMSTFGSYGNKRDVEAILSYDDQKEYSDEEQKHLLQNMEYIIENSIRISEYTFKCGRMYLKESLLEKIRDIYAKAANSRGHDGKNALRIVRQKDRRNYISRDLKKISSAVENIVEEGDNNSEQLSVDEVNEISNQVLNESLKLIKNFKSNIELYIFLTNFVENWLIIRDDDSYGCQGVFYILTHPSVYATSKDLVERLIKIRLKNPTKKSQIDEILKRVNDDIRTITRVSLENINSMGDFNHYFKEIMLNQPPLGPNPEGL